MKEMHPGRQSTRQLQRKFDSPPPETKQLIFQDRSIPPLSILHKNEKTIYFPKKMGSVPIVKQPQRGCSNQSAFIIGNATMTYDDIKPIPIEKSVIDRIYTKLFTTEQEICKCPNSHLPNTCSLALQWLGQTDIPKIKDKFNTLLKKQCDPKQIKQITMDVERTHPLKGYSTKLTALKQVLKAYAIYEPKIAYMQGMNFIAATLVYHSDDYIAFELFTRLIEQLPLKDLYLPMSPGLSKHIQLIDYLILTKLPDLYQHFCNNGIKADMFCASWLFSLFGIMIPFKNMGQMITKVFSEGWTYIYKLIIAFLLYNQELLLSEDMTGMICILSQQNYRVDNNMEVDWEELLEAASNLKISKTFIQEMHLKFDSKGQVFKI